MGTNPSLFHGPDHPVQKVSLNERQDFIMRASHMDGRKYRLPKEKEWEFACRAGSTTDWGRRANGECGPLETMGWYADNNGVITRAVALKEPNAWGLFDMHGNVREVCEVLDDRGNVYLTCRGGCFKDCTKDCTTSAVVPYPVFDDKIDSSCLGFRLADGLSESLPELRNGERGKGVKQKRGRKLFSEN